MKKRILLILLSVSALLSLAFGICACASSDESKNNAAQDASKDNETQNSDDSPAEELHVHEFSLEWTANDKTHWHAAICGHEEKSGEAAHTYVAGICSVCDHAHVNHVFEEWHTLREATHRIVGIEQHDCMCGKYERREIPKYPEQIVCGEFGLTAYIHWDAGKGQDVMAYQVSNYTGNASTVKVPAYATFPNREERVPVEQIGEDAFQNHTSIQTVILNDNITTIRYHAFRNCKNLTSIFIPLSVTVILTSPFYGCPSNIKVSCEAPFKPTGWDSLWDEYHSYRYGNNNQYVIIDRFTPTWGCKPPANYPRTTTTSTNAIKQSPAMPLSFLSKDKDELQKRTHLERRSTTK